jgi:hypothetical protein
MKETIVPQGRKLDNKVNISLNRETVEQLAKFKDDLGNRLGMTLSYAQTIQHLINKANPTT